MPTHDHAIAAPAEVVASLQAAVRLGAHQM
jgi:hypothetical protein